MILSFDVGIKNLAFCAVTENLMIQKWEVCTIPSPQTNFDGLITFMNSLDFDPTTVSTVLVEKQPSRNCKMRIMEAILMTFFKVKGFDKVVSFNPKLKLGKELGKTIKGRSNYSTRKKYGILLTNRFITDYPQSESMRTAFEKHKKKDDMSDALLQALCYMQPALVENLGKCIVTI